MSEMLKGILAVSGQSGLYKLVSQAKSSIIVESLKDGKRMPAYATSRISALEDISIFTEEADVKLIDVFKTIVTEGTGNAAVLAGGISEALLTTAGGLSIAIPTIVFYNLFNKKVENLIVEMEHHSIILHELLSTEYTASTAEE